MSHDDKANDIFDTKLSRLFAEKNEPLPASEFISVLLPRLERAYRAQLLRRILLTTVVLLLAAFLTPLVVRMTMGLFSFAEKMEVTSNTSSILMIVVTLGVFFWSRKRI